MNIPLLLNLVSEAYRIAAEQSRLPSDLVLRNYFRQKSFLGKRDRQSVSRIFWHALRHKSRLEWDVIKDVSPSVMPLISVEELVIRAFRDLYPEAEAPVFRKEDAISRAWKITDKIPQQENMPDHVLYSLPEWMWKRLKTCLLPEDLYKTGETLLTPGGLHLRVNVLKSSVDNVLRNKSELDIRQGNLLPEALRIGTRTAITHHNIYRKGWVEIQDEGSQLIARAANPRNGELIVDACAGGGGKSLHLAALTKNKARIIATDKYPERLIELMRRAGRADARIQVMDQKEVFKTLTGQADILILDVPCSGSGTLRRRPDLKWNLTPAAVREYVTLQRQILKKNIPLLKPDGRLVYATCSILPEENEDQMEYMLKTIPHFKPVQVSDILKAQNINVKQNKTPWMRILPQDYDTDGYFIGVLSPVK
jgi:16S rRNA (cytosine967-C5)-methyltransferase